MLHTKEYYEDFSKEFDPKIIIWEGVDWNNVMLKLSKVVHLLFWWQSWSWKSVFLLQFLFQVLFLTNPNSLKLILVDPLRVSFKDFKQLPHLLQPVANTPAEAVEAVMSMITVNRERYQFLENTWFENIYEYNEALLEDKIPYLKDWMRIIVPYDKISEEYKKKVNTESYTLWEPIPQLILFMDEVNALMLDETFWGKTPESANSPVLKALVGVSEQARKSWILLFMWTQKIDAKSMPNKVRWNMKTRICLKVTSSQISTAILWDTPENRRDWSKLTWNWDGLVFNEELDIKNAVRFQGAYVRNQDLLDIINWFITAYWKNSFDYITVNEEYAKNSEDLEPQPISYEDYKDWLPDIVTVKDNVFLLKKYQKLLTQLITEPFFWDEKTIKLRYPSISKDLKIIQQQFTDVWILSFNTPESSKEDDSKKNEWYFWLNLKLKGLSKVLSKVNFIPWEKETWDSKYNEDYQVLMMKLLLIHLNKYYIPAWKKLSLDIDNYS